MSEKNGKLVRQYVTAYNESLEKVYAGKIAMHEQEGTKQQLVKQLNREKLREKLTKRVFDQMAPKDKVIQRRHMERYLQDHGGPTQ